MEKILVDLSHFHPDSGETEKYKKIKQKLIIQLSQRFGYRVQLMPDGELIEIVLDKPPTNHSSRPPMAAAEFNRYAQRE